MDGGSNPLDRTKIFEFVLSIGIFILKNLDRTKAFPGNEGPMQNLASFTSNLSSLVSSF